MKSFTVPSVIRPLLLNPPIANIRNVMIDERLKAICMYINDFKMNILSRLSIYKLITEIPAIKKHELKTTCGGEPVNIPWRNKYVTSKSMEANNSKDFFSIRKRLFLYTKSAKKEMPVNKTNTYKL